jgi:hypothetical protein
MEQHPGALARYWPIIQPALTYGGILLFLWLFLRLFGGHIKEFIEDVVGEIISIATAGWSLAFINAMGTILLFILIVLLMVDAKFDFLYGVTPPPEYQHLMEIALIGFLIFAFGVILIFSIALSKT